MTRKPKTSPSGACRRQLVAAALLLIVPACKSTTPGPGSGGLPSMGFVQLKDDVVGSVDRIDTFGKETDKYGVLLGRSAAEGKTELLVDDGGRQTKIAGPAFFLMPHAAPSGGFRAVCVVEYGARPRGQGPVGPVYELAREVTPELLCFVNRGDDTSWSETWERVVIERGELAGKIHALWPLIVGAAPLKKDSGAKGAISLFWVRDTLWDAAWMTNAGRGPGDKTVERTLILRDDGTFTLGELSEFATYLDASMFTRAVAPRCDASNCGALWNGYEMLACPRTCAGGESCIVNECKAESCTPRTAKVACLLEDTSQQRCGKAIDGCGGVLECGGCPAGESCGGGGVPGACGRYRMTEPRLRQLYADPGNLLCGSFDDLAGGTLDLSKANVAKIGLDCAGGATCRQNLCLK